ncbi:MULTISPECIES: DUF1127 domain-containing protein [Roseobacteraceae]|uniref:DUF1127 domain-containing protein n=1 Tax=Roseobacteraceae TaxID=2854170 RepID=UPI00080AABF9|nr:MULTISPECIES: DUF1127 domain-containing protein [Roseobacteraceae]ANT60959.1 hypothetical protein AYJ57_11645 [Salipiger sp. CCB-MM3]MCA0994186.1 DUF1127 domain-containing protein [Alloyangia pacifica]NDW02106.1 DUF1127 domain-containing protein [Salipiger sp. PrR002]NDW59318.1 DUF1127 domain-containing protein [Salipiger sp. PrR004]
MAFATDTTRIEGRTGGLLDTLRTALARRRLYKQTFSELASLSNRELSDLGLHRSMIRRIAYQAAYEA